MIDCKAMRIGRVRNDCRPREIEMTVVVDVVKWYRGVFEGPVVMVALQPQESCDAERVDEDGISACDGVTETVQEL